MQSETVRVQFDVGTSKATVTFQDSGTHPPHGSGEGQRWKITYEFYYEYDGGWKLTGGKTTANDRVLLNAVPESLSKYFDP